MTDTVTSYLHYDVVAITGCRYKYFKANWVDMAEWKYKWAMMSGKSFHRNTNKTFRWSSLEGLNFLKQNLLTRIWVICIQVKTQEIKLWHFFDHFNSCTENISLFFDRGQSKTKNQRKMWGRYYGCLFLKVWPKNN